MNYALKELVGALRPRVTLLVGQSKHVRFRHDRLVWQKSVPKEPAWRVVLAELDSTNPVFSFGLLREKPADDRLAHWVDACLDQRPRARVQVNEIVIARKLWERSAPMTEVLAHHSLRVSHPAAGFDAGIHYARFADDVLRKYVWEAGTGNRHPFGPPRVGTTRRYRPCSARRDSTGKQRPG